MKIGILSGHYIPDLIKNPEKILVETPYGTITVHISKLGNHELYFIHRHGEESNLPPHKVNYRGNIQALASCHVSCILSVATVGSMKMSIKPGDIVVPDDFIDVTKSRPLTFYDDERVHVDMTAPFCPSLREVMIQSIKKIKGVNVHEKSVYLTTEGPRLETASEIKFFSSVADIVGMTVVPEVILAREKGICYATLCLVCNMAAGLQNRVTADELTVIYKKKEPVISKILQVTIGSLDEKQACQCGIDVSKATL
jgi:5'-methylthioadenosine phosphorylase